MPIDNFTARHLHNSSMAARERRDQEFPAFGVYAWSAKNLPINHPSAIPAPAESTPNDLTIKIDQSALPYMEEGLTFLNVNRIESSNVLEVETWWRVEKGPINRPLSIMAHLITEQGHTLEISDGLSASPLSWEAGDIIVQQHTFAASCKYNPKLWLRTGVYWLDTFERWKVNSTSDDAIFISLCDIPQLVNP
jgi:hypothetical protein